MDSEDTAVCPECGTAGATFFRKRKRFVCAECEHDFERVAVVVERRVFLSYGHDEWAPLARRLRADLEALGHKVWIDEDQLRAGGDWENKIDAGLAWTADPSAQGRVLLLMTPHAVRRPSGYCLNELARALTRGVTVVPAMVASCEAPLSICRLQWLDLRDCADPDARAERYDARLAQVVQALDHGRAEVDGVQARVLGALQPLPFDAEISGHLQRFVGRQWFFDDFDAWIANPAASRVLLVTASPGLGKSAIAAWLCARRPEVAAFHLCRHGDVQKANPRWCVRSIAYQLASQLPEYQRRLNALPLEKLIEECNAQALFDRLVVQPLHGNFPRPAGPLVVLVDGLDEATIDKQNELADFLATEFVKTPDWLRLLLFSRPDPEVTHPLQGFPARSLDEHRAESDADLAGYVTRELAAFAPGGALDRATVDAVVARSGGLFLYVDRLRAELAEGHLSLANTDAFPRRLRGMFAQFFRRQFPDVEAYERGVRPGLELVVAAREPLPTALLADALGADPYAVSRFRRALGSLFVTVDETLRPFHATLVDWLTVEGSAGRYFVIATTGHERLAEASLKQLAGGAGAASPYALRHAADHLLALGRAEALAALLAREDFVAAHQGLDPYRLRAWWTSLERLSPERGAWLRRSLLESPPSVAARCDDAADLLNSLGHWSDALTLYDRAIALAEAEGDLAQVANAHIDEAGILRARGKSVEAHRRLDRAEALLRTLDEPAELRRSLALRANLWSAEGEHAPALALLAEVERSSRSDGDDESLVGALQGRAWIVSSTGGHHDDALALLDEADRLCRLRGLHEARARTLSLAGRVEAGRGDDDAARARHQSAARGRFEEMEALCRQYGMSRSLAICRNDQGELARRQGRWDDAEAAYADVEAIASKLGSALNAAVAQGNRASVLAGRGRPDEALALLARSIAVVRAAGTPYTLVQGLLQQAELLGATESGRQEALDCADEALALALEKGFGALATHGRRVIEGLRSGAPGG